MTTTAVRFNPFDPDFQANPYPTYDRLRREDPIHWSFLKAWVITRYADAEFILKDPRFIVDDLPERLLDKNRYLKQGNLNVLSKTIEKWLFFVQPPDHTRLRGLVSKAFSPASMQALRPEIQAVADSLIAKVEHFGKMDIMNDFANPLPAIILMKILGLPLEDYQQVMCWSYELFPVFEQPMSLNMYQKQNQIVVEVKKYLLQNIIQIEKHPNNGLLSQLIAYKKLENKLTQDEILGFCVMLFLVGQETTKSFVGNAMLALLNYPEKMKELKQNSEIIENAVEELLRYDSPIQLITRLAKEDVEFGGKTLREGDKIVIYIGAANRDPEKFSQPNQLNFNRRNQSLPFGSGIHFCLGAFLARIQSQIAINTLLQRLPTFKLNSNEIIRRNSRILRSIESLYITF
ncbi:MAG: cytochrome P450 [Aphanothece sp. CMT-3BRIN-NPC111]|jgi:hypothetical protein|nr:cytochrome P450 [Aphanothece sp. CMT-3BRIN-NPC111]